MRRMAEEHSELTSRSQAQQSPRLARLNWSILSRLLLKNISVLKVKDSHLQVANHGPKARNAIYLLHAGSDYFSLEPLTEVQGEGSDRFENDMEGVLRLSNAPTYVSEFQVTCENLRTSSYPNHQQPKTLQKVDAPAVKTVITKSQQQDAVLSEPLNRLNLSRSSSYEDRGLVPVKILIKDIPDKNYHKRFEIYSNEDLSTKMLCRRRGCSQRAIVLLTVSLIRAHRWATNNLKR